MRCVTMRQPLRMGNVALAGSDGVGSLYHGMITLDFLSSSMKESVWHDKGWMGIAGVYRYDTSRVF